MTTLDDEPVARPKVVLSRPLQTKDELWKVVKALFGIEIRTRGRRLRRCTRPGSGTATCRMRWPHSPWPTMRLTGGPRRLRGRGLPRTSFVSRSQRELSYGPGEPALLAVGEVWMVEEETDSYVIS